MKVLIIGDSITEGKLGINYVDMLKSKMPAMTFVNMGLGGDTLYGIGKRLIDALDKASYDIIVIEAGHNDLLIPTMKTMNRCYQFTAAWLEKRGSLPLSEVSSFEQLYNDIVSKVKQLTNAKIIITTLSCLGENLQTEINQKRNLYNAAVQRVAKEHQCELADISQDFERHLEDRDISNFFLGHYHDAFIFDAPKTSTVKGAKRLSDKRLLYLTIDGIHINSEGAMIYSNLISEKIQKVAKESTQNKNVHIVTNGC